MWFFRKLITVTVERLSDNSRITFTISSDKKIKHLRSLLNHHLPPSTPNKFYLYSFQRGAFIHYHPPSFKLDYFPVIFDQSVLLLKMDDRNINTNDGKNLYKETNKSRWSLLKYFPSSKTTSTTPVSRNRTNKSSSNISCLSILKQVFHHPSKSINRNVDCGTNILAY